MTASGGGAATPAATPSIPRPVFPADARQAALRMAKEDGTAPARDSEVAVADYDGGYGPELIWRAEQTGGFCMADVSEMGVSKKCASAEQMHLDALPVPGAGKFLGAARFTDHGHPAWAWTLMASGEEIDHLSCQGRVFAARAVFSSHHGNVPVVVYTVTVPEDLPGEFRVAVRRDDGPAEERVVLNPGESATVQC
ncbi:hypothetical protein ACWC9T_30425 [Kitasatospora sp. NPDC001159]